jgi:pimeloyl-ACP methyl ester carboxylesterase
MMTIVARLLTRGLRWATWMALALATIFAGAIAVNGFTHDRTPSIPGGIASLEKIALGGVEQSLLIRGRHADNPVLLVLHGGPGMTQMYLAHRFQAPLEEDFVVVQWDRRGAGKSYRADLPRGTLRTSRLLADAEELVPLLRRRFGGRRLLLMGHSWGSYLGVLLASRRPEDFAGYVGVGQMAARQIREREMQSRFVAEKAEAAGDREAAAAAARPGGSLEPWLFAYGAEVHSQTSWLPMLGYGLGAPEYTFGDAIKLMRGLRSYQEQFVDDGPPTDLMDAVGALDLPTYFFIGRFDMICPWQLAEQYFRRLKARHKRWVWFEQSAHFPFLEEPARFAEEMRNVRNEVF